MIATLLWKDYRQNRRLLIALVLFLAIPYAFAIIYGGVSRLREPEYYPRASWSEMFMVASVVSLSELVVACAFIAGNAFAGERADRSAEFVGYLPIPRPASTMSRAILAIGSCVTLALCNLAIFCTAAGWVSNERSHPPVELFVSVAATAVLLFGVAWFASSFLRSAAIAAAAGIMLMVVVGSGLAMIDYIRGGHDADTIMKNWYAPMCLLVGLTAFTAGCVHSLRRIEP